MSEAANERDQGQRGYESDSELVRVGRALKAVRVMRGMTQQEVADKAHMNRDTYAKIENAKGNPTLRNFLKAMRALNVSLASLLRDVARHDDLSQ